MDIIWPESCAIASVIENAFIMIQDFWITIKSNFCCFVDNFFILDNILIKKGYTIDEQKKHTLSNKSQQIFAQSQWMDEHFLLAFYLIKNFDYLSMDNSSSELQIIFLPVLNINLYQSLSFWCSKSARQTVKLGLTSALAEVSSPGLKLSNDFFIHNRTF